MIKGYLDSKNNKIFDLHKLWEEIGLEKKCRFRHFLKHKIRYLQYFKLYNIFSIYSKYHKVYENCVKLNIQTRFHKNLFITKWVIFDFFLMLKITMKQHYFQLFMYIFVILALISPFQQNLK